ncbi:uncharacterized protein LOC113273299 [Papaver somniferum]|uniref:uncharacterized protein LOC113273299 n=1 Tax=Papaver somniferum TaxID=3469 RepID=UPI000E702865|nr:uncharacterized protein LOC113273299 [Papaver somniferum]
MVIFVAEVVMVRGGTEGVSWNGAATNFPIFAEIVPDKSPTSIYSLDRTFESILASFTPPAVGLLSQHVCGYKPIPQGSTQSVEIEMGRGNAASLAKELYASIAIPMILCCLIYSFLYSTYPIDRNRARMKALALIESEMVQLEPNYLLAEGESSQFQDSEARRKDTVIGLDYGRDITMIMRKGPNFLIQTRINKWSIWGLRIEIEGKQLNYNDVNLTTFFPVGLQETFLLY